jgi:hypothetical protein
MMRGALIIRSTGVKGTDFIQQRGAGYRSKASLVDLEGLSERRRRWLDSL